MNVIDYLTKMCELGLGNSVVRVIEKGDCIYENTMSNIVDNSEKYPWANNRVLGFSSFATSNSGKGYNTLISI